MFCGSRLPSLNTDKGKTEGLITVPVVRYSPYCPSGLTSLSICSYSTSQSVCCLQGLPHCSNKKSYCSSVPFPEATHLSLSPREAWHCAQVMLQLLVSTFAKNSF